MSFEERKQKNLQDKRRKELIQTIKEKGKLWAIAAMIDGSIGYHTYVSAEIRIRELMEDRYVSGSERCMACFGGNANPGSFFLSNSNLDSLFIQVIF